MKTMPYAFALAVLLAAAHSSNIVVAQNAPRRAPPGGFDRPLAVTPRYGNPGASPTLTNTEFKALLGHWADFDANKNQRFDKTEVPELFAGLFDQADANHDGALDEKERAAVKVQTAAASQASATARPAQPPPQGQPRNSGPPGDPLLRAVFGDPLFGVPQAPPPAR